MNSQNPNPNEGQQPGTPSEDRPATDPGATRAERQNTEPERIHRPAKTTRSRSTAPTGDLAASCRAPAERRSRRCPAGALRPGRPAAELLRLDPQPRHTPGTRPVDRRRLQRHRGTDGHRPLIVRGIFIVLTLFAGIGVLLYGLGWALLPEPDGRIHVQEAGAGRWSSGMTGALITTVVGLTGLGGGFWGWGHDGFGGFLWTVFWVGGAIYLIYYLTQRNKARNGAP